MDRCVSQAAPGGGARGDRDAPTPPAQLTDARRLEARRRAPRLSLGFERVVGDERKGRTLDRDQIRRLFLGSRPRSTHSSTRSTTTTWAVSGAKPRGQTTEQGQCECCTGPLEELDAHYAQSSRCQVTCHARYPAAPVLPRSGTETEAPWLTIDNGTFAHTLHPICRSCRSTAQSWWRTIKIRIATPSRKYYFRFRLVWELAGRPGGRIAGSTNHWQCCETARLGRAAALAGG